MGKSVNENGKFAHGTRKGDVDKSKHWKYGKSSGHPDPEVAKARRERKGKRRLKN